MTAMKNTNGAALTVGAIFIALASLVVSPAIRFLLWDQTADAYKHVCLLAFLLLGTAVATLAWSRKVIKQTLLWFALMTPLSAVPFFALISRDKLDAFIQGEPQRRTMNFCNFVLLGAMHALFWERSFRWQIGTAAWFHSCLHLCRGAIIYARTGDSAIGARLMQHQIYAWVVGYTCLKLLVCLRNASLSSSGHIKPHLAGVARHLKSRADSLAMVYQGLWTFECLRLIIGDTHAHALRIVELEPKEEWLIMCVAVGANIGMGLTATNGQGLQIAIATYLTASVRSAIVLCEVGETEAKSDFFRMALRSQLALPILSFMLAASI